MFELQSLLTLPLFGGIAGLIYASARAYVLIRGGARTKERDTVQDRAEWHAALVRRAEWAEAQLDWWRGFAADLEYVIRTRLGDDAVPRRRPFPVREEADGRPQG